MPELTRRETIVSVGAVTAAATASLPLATRRVLATSSGDSELVVNGTIPETVTVDATIDEYDTEGSETPINSQTETVTTAGEPTVYDGLEGESDYSYEFELSVTGDGESTPELEKPLRFDIPADPEDFERVDFTDEQDWDAKRDETDIVWDEYYLRQYQPKLSLNQSTQNALNGMYGYVAESEDEDLDVLCYWTRLNQLESLPGDGIGSDLGDHEPIYVFVDSESGDVDRIVYSAYRWDAAELSGSSLELEADRTAERTHMTFKVAETWHYYKHAPDSDGEFVELKPWPEVRDSWLANNFGPEPASVEDPWQMLEEPDWREDSLFSLTDIWINLSKTLGWNGAKNIDTLRE